MARARSAPRRAKAAASGTSGYTEVRALFTVVGYRDGDATCYHEAHHDGETFMLPDEELDRLVGLGAVEPVKGKGKAKAEPEAEPEPEPEPKPES